MTGIAAAVAAVNEGWDHISAESVIFGSDEPEAIAAEIERWCAVHLGASVARCDWYHSSVGCVFGLVLADDSALVVKALPPRFGVNYLTASRLVQRRLHGSGVAVAEPLSEPRRCGLGHAFADAVLGPFPEEGPPSRLGAASALARLVALAGPPPAGLSPHPLDRPSSATYPEPHSPFFDFGRDQAGAAWIDELAVRALRFLDADDRGTQVVGHLDWRAANTRFVDDRLAAVYDLDSLAVADHAVVAGQAAVVWRGDDPFPPPDEIDGFVADYAQAADIAISLARARAAAQWLVAYVARCEHALDLADGPAIRLLRHGSLLR